MSAQTREITFAEAIREAIREEMKRDQKVLVLGEDVGVYGNIFGVLPGLVDEFGCERVRDTPISEEAIIGASVGAAAAGLRPIPEIMFSDFTGRCMDDILNQLAKMRYMSGGQVKLPVVVRTTIGAGLRAAAQHSQSIEALFTHIPGLYVVVPSTPYDAKGLLKTAVRGDNPVMYFEHKLLYNVKGPVPEEEYLLPIGKGDIKKEGRDITIVAYANMVQKSLVAAEELEKQGVSVEIIDPRSLYPFDKQLVLDSVKKTGKLVIVHEAVKTGGIGAEISAIVAEEAFDFLDAPIKRVAAPHVPIPFSPVLEDAVIPSEKEIMKAIKEIL